MYKLSNNKIQYAIVGMAPKIGQRPGCGMHRYSSAKYIYKGAKIKRDIC